MMGWRNSAIRTCFIFIAYQETTSQLPRQPFISYWLRGIKEGNHLWGLSSQITQRNRWNLRSQLLLYSQFYQQHRFNQNFIILINCSQIAVRAITFMELTNRVFHDYFDEFIIVFVNDILIYSHNEQLHEEHLRLTLEVLRKNKIYAKFSKCDFCMNEVLSLCHIIYKDGVLLNHPKLRKLWNGNNPRMSQKLKIFLDLLCKICALWLRILLVVRLNLAFGLI